MWSEVTKTQKDKCCMLFLTFAFSLQMICMFNLEYIYVEARILETIYWWMDAVKE